MSSRQENISDFVEDDLERGAEHSALQNAAAEIRHIPIPALRLLVAEYLKEELDKIIEESASEIINEMRFESRQVH